MKLMEARLRGFNADAHAVEGRIHSLDHLAKVGDVDGAAIQVRHEEQIMYANQMARGGFRNNNGNIPGGALLKTLTGGMFGDDSPDSHPAHIPQHLQQPGMYKPGQTSVHGGIQVNQPGILSNLGSMGGILPQDPRFNNNQLLNPQAAGSYWDPNAASIPQV
tara:strand:- start:250 stop:735 length:486 start_codon:yes stop_codon:yes gene_type:complete